MKGSLKGGICPVLTAMINGKEETLAYKYENADGQRFWVLTVCADSPAYGLLPFRAYEIQAALHRGIEWIAKKPLPVKTTHAPELYTLCEKGDGYTSVILLNCFHDSVLSPVIELDRAYGHVEICGCNGRIGGTRVIIDGEIHAYDFIAIKAFD